MSERTLVHRCAMSILGIRVMNILNNLVGISLRSIMRVQSTLQLKTILSGDSIIDLNIYVPITEYFPGVSDLVNSELVTHYNIVTYCNAFVCA